MNPSDRTKIADFFDTMCISYLNNTMTKYINMELLENDFIDGIWKSINEWKQYHIENPDDDGDAIIDILGDNVNFWFNTFELNEPVLEAEAEIEKFVSEY